MDGYPTYSTVTYGFYVRYRDKLIVRLRHSGVLLGPCGEKSVRVRPSLTLRPKHAEILLDALDGVMARMEEEQQ